MSDLAAYIAFCQRQLLTPGAEDLFSAARAQRAWQAEIDRVRPASEQGSEPDLEESMNRYRDFVPETPFDVPDTHAIFQPHLSTITATALQSGIRPLRPIKLATSTDLSVTPYARPAAVGEHLLFVGFGTSLFCNYWAKVYAEIARGLAANCGQARCENRDVLETALRRDPTPLVLAQRLAWHYAAHDTLVGFGKVSISSEAQGHRTQLLNSMELFIMAHEFSHFVIEERLPAWRGSLEANEVHASELFCDELGFSLSRQSEAARNSFDAFCGVGALIFFRAMELTLAIRDRIRSEQSRAGGHPSFETRIELIRQVIDARTAADQREIALSFFDEYDIIATSLRDILLEVLDKPGTLRGSGPAAG